MCILPPKPTVEFVTQTLLTTSPTTIPPTTKDEFMERRSDETESSNGYDANKKVRNKMFSQRFHPTYILIQFSEDRRYDHKWFR